MNDAASRIANWIHAVSLKPEATRLDAVSGAAASLTKSTGETEILDLVLLAHGIAHGEAVSTVAAALHDHGEASAVREGDLLASVTAAVVVASALEAEASIAVPFGLAVRSANFLGLEPAVPELDALARAGLARASETQRRRDPLSVVEADVASALKDWQVLQSGAPVASEDLNSAREAVDEAAKAAAAVTTRALPPITRRFEALEEEVDVLWWAFGEFSERAANPFNSVPIHAAGCLAGIELAALTAQRAPLPSSRAILSRILQSRWNKSTDLSRALPAAVQIIGDEWLDDRPDAHPLRPVFSSLEEYRSLNHKPIWKEAVEERWGVKPARATTVLDLAEQVTREVLLTRVPSE